MRHVLMLLIRDAGVTINLKYCKFFFTTIFDLGHIIHGGQLTVSQHTIDGMQNLKTQSVLRN